MPIAMRSRLPKPPAPKREKKVKAEPAAEEDTLPEEATAQSAWVRPVVGGVVFFIVVSALISFYYAVFRDLPPHIDVSTPAGVTELQNRLHGGPPAAFFCNNGTVNRQARSVFEGAYSELKGEVYFASVNCHAVLPSGKSLIEKLSLAALYDPIWFATSHGRKPTQLSPALVHRKSELVTQLRALTISRVSTLGNSVDLKKCISDRAGGCVVVYSERSTDAVKEELDEGVLKARPLLKLAALPARDLALRLKPETAGERILDATVKFAKGASGQAAPPPASSDDDEDDAPPPPAPATQGPRTDVLVYFRPVPAAARGSVSHRFLVTAAAAVTPGAVSLFDVDAVVAQSDKAVAFLSKSAEAAAPAEGGVDIDALLAREDELESLLSATLDDVDAQITWSDAKMPKATPRPAYVEPEGPLSPEQRRERRAALKKTYGSAAGRAAADDDEEEDEPEDPAVTKAREFAARQAMAAAEAESAFVAHLAEDEEGGAGGEDAHAGGAAHEDVESEDID